MKRAIYDKVSMAVVQWQDDTLHSYASMEDWQASLDLPDDFEPPGSADPQWVVDGALSATAPVESPEPPAPTPAQLAQAALSAGLAITSTATPALNGTYAADQLSQMHIIAIETSLNAGKGFPGGATTFSYPDATGALHGFSPANFTEFAAAVRDFVYALNSVIGGASTTLPSSSARIA